MEATKLTSVVGALAGHLRAVDVGLQQRLVGLSYDTDEPVVERWVELDELRHFTSEQDPPDEDLIRKWNTIVMVMSKGRFVHHPHQWFGSSLNRAGYSRRRLARLLRSQGRMQHVLSRRCVQFLISRREKANLTDLVRLVLYPCGSHGTELRDRIKHSYGIGEIR